MRKVWKVSWCERVTYTALITADDPHKWNGVKQAKVIASLPREVVYEDSDGVTDLTFEEVAQ